MTPSPGPAARAAAPAGAPAVAPALNRALAGGPPGLDALASELPRLLPCAPRDRALALLALYDLQARPASGSGRWARHPTVARLQWELEEEWLAELTAAALPDDLPALADPADADAPGAVVGALRALAARDRLPPVYRWLAREASYDEIVAFLALEGGPDAGFDDLVAACQVGLTGRPKLELATNYWDEMGGGDLDAVHTELHDRLVAAIDMPHVGRAEQPLESLERLALGGLLAANHWLQPEMLGALGLVELQAGPRCRLVLQAFDRVGAPRAAYPFYEVHAEVDPRHGRDWVDNAVVPVLAEHPDWAPRIVRGAWWRSLVNRRFFDTAGRLVAATGAAA